MIVDLEKYGWEEFSQEEVKEALKTIDEFLDDHKK